MDREEGKKISGTLEESIKNLGDALKLAKPAMSEDEYEGFKRHVGLAIGKISCELLDPIYVKYPDLAPPGVF